MSLKKNRIYLGHQSGNVVLDFMLNKGFTRLMNPPTKSQKKKKISEFCRRFPYSVIWD